MKCRIMSLIVLSCIMLTQTTSASAQEFSWQGVQLQTVIGGEIPLYKKALALRANVTHFCIPKNNLYMFFSYAGIKWNIADWIWISPQVGVVLNWGEDSHEAFIASLWINFSFFKGKFTIFLEGETYLNNEISDYYGYYSLDYNFHKNFGLGIHAEQVNKGVMFGPHIGMFHKIWSLQVQYYIGAQEDINFGHAIRIFTMLYFK